MATSDCNYGDFRLASSYQLWLPDMWLLVAVFHHRKPQVSLLRALIKACNEAFSRIYYRLYCSRSWLLVNRNTSLLCLYLCVYSNNSAFALPVTNLAASPPLTPLVAVRSFIVLGF